MKNAPRDLEKEQAVFAEWRGRNPTAQFKKFYAERAKLALDASTPHGSLGANLINEPFGVAGLQILGQLAQYGLKPTDICVDFGCGTLRLGIHVMRHLKPGAYWGMDIADFFLEEGKALVGTAALEQARPNLRVISQQTVAEAAAAKPTFLFSSKVLQHVHPDELPHYFSDIVTIIGTTGQAVILSHWSAGETYQYAARGWDHATKALEDAVVGAGGAMFVLTQDQDAKKPERIKGDFLILHKDVASDANHRFYPNREKKQEKFGMKVIVTATKFDEVLAQSEFEVEDKNDLRNIAKCARKAFTKYVKENPNIEFVGEGVQISFKLG